MEVICQFCKSASNKVDKKEAVVIDKKNFHEKCGKLYSDRKELYETVVRIFKLKAPGPRNIALINKYYNEGMTFRGMNFSLIYFYEIKKNSIKKANEGVGIIPYIYEEAKKYYDEKKIREERTEKQIEKINEMNK